MKFILFLIPGLLLLGVAGWLIYVSIIKCFFVQAISGKLIIAGILLAIIFGFFAVSAISRFYENTLIKYLYFGFAVLIGVWVFAFFFSIVGWIIIGLAKLFGISAAPHIVMIVMMTLALIYSGYNIWNAYEHKTTNINIPIKNLREIW